MTPAEASITTERIGTSKILSYLSAAVLVHAHPGLDLTRRLSVVLETNLSDDIHIHIARGDEVVVGGVEVGTRVRDYFIELNQLLRGMRKLLGNAALYAHGLHQWHIVANTDLLDGDPRIRSDDSYILGVVVKPQTHFNVRIWSNNRPNGAVVTDITGVGEWKEKATTTEP